MTLETGNASVPDQDDHYFLGASEEERERLLVQGHALRPSAVQLLDRIGVQRNWAVADVGCGPLGILDLLAERVLPEGRICGVEREPRMIGYLRRTLAHLGIAVAEVVEADATEIPLPSESFDLVHARLLLVHAPDPGRLLAELFRLARPGGTVACQEADLRSLACVPSLPEWDVLNDAVLAAWGSMSDPFLGRRLPSLLADAGVEDLDVAAYVRLVREGEPNFRALPAVAALRRKDVVSAGLLTEVEFDRALAAVNAHLAKSGTRVLTGTIYQAWGRKPAG